jgi:hypothetical protein
MLGSDDCADTARNRILNGVWSYALQYQVLMFQQFERTFTFGA